MLIVKGTEAICQRIYNPVATKPVIALPDPDTCKVLLTAGASGGGDLFVIVLSDPRSKGDSFTAIRTDPLTLLQGFKGFASGIEGNLADFLDSIIRHHLVTDARCTVDLSIISSEMTQHTRCVDCVMQSIMSAAGRFLHHLQSLQQGVLALVPGNLDAEEFLNIIGLGNRIVLHLVHDEVAAKNFNISSAPGEEDAVLCAPAGEVGERLLKREPILQIIIRDIGQPGNRLVHRPIVLGFHHDFEGIDDLKVLIQLHSSNLNDLTP